MLLHLEIFIFKGVHGILKIRENESNVAKMIENEVPLKRFGKPEEVCGCSYLFKF